MSVSVAFILLVVCFAVLAKCADWFVDGAVGIAEHFNVPKMLIGIVLVSMATTAPELAVSVMSAMSGAAEIALGNAIGSVIVDDTLAIGLAAAVTAAPIAADPKLLKTTGVFLIVVDVIAYWLVWDGELSRGEGAVLLVLFFIYLVFTYVTQRQSHEMDDDLTKIEDSIAGKSLSSLVFWFVLGLAGVLVCWFGGFVCGLLVRWFAGLLVSWFAGLLVCWFGGFVSGLLVGWFAGFLVCWCAGLLVWWFGWWFAGLLVSWFMQYVVL